MTSRLTALTAAALCAFALTPPAQAGAAPRAWSVHSVVQLHARRYCLRRTALAAACCRGRAAYFRANLEPYPFQ